MMPFTHKHNTFLLILNVLQENAKCMTRCALIKKKSDDDVTKIRQQKADVQQRVEGEIAQMSWSISRS